MGLMMYVLMYVHCRRLLTELAAFRDSKPSSDDVTSTTSDRNRATYQIYYRPEQAKFSNSVRVCGRQ